MTGKLVEHCRHIEVKAFKLSERVHMQYLENHPVPVEGIQRTQMFTQAQMVADEVVRSQMVEV